MTTPNKNTVCAHCGYTWSTRSTLKMISCPNCLQKTLNPQWLRNNNIKLYRLWSFDSNDRSEIAHVIARSFKDAQQFALSYYVETQYQKDVELSECGIEWSICGDCNASNDLAEETKEEICGTCENNIEGIQIEETEEINTDDLSFKTIMGTNDFFDLTTKYVKKSQNWNDTLARAWKIDPQKGCDTLLNLTKIAMAKRERLDTSETLKKLDKKAKE